MELGFEFSYDSGVSWDNVRERIRFTDIIYVFLTCSYHSGLEVVQNNI